MNNNRFREQMEKLEQERDEYVNRLTPERQHEYRQKEDEFNSNSDQGTHAAIAEANQVTQ